MSLTINNLNKSELKAIIKEVIQEDPSMIKGLIKEVLQEVKVDILDKHSTSKNSINSINFSDEMATFEVARNRELEKEQKVEPNTSKLFTNLASILIEDKEVLEKLAK